MLMDMGDYESAIEQLTKALEVCVLDQVSYSQ